MTLLKGTLVRIKDSSPYFLKYRQGVVDGVKVVGIVIEEGRLPTWYRVEVQWDVKVRWPYHKQGAFAYYVSQRDLEVIPPFKKNLSEFL